MNASEENQETWEIVFLPSHGKPKLKLFLITVVVIFGLGSYNVPVNAQSLFGEWSELRDDPSGCLKDDTKCLETYKETGCPNTPNQYQCAQAHYQKQQIQPVKQTVTETQQTTLEPTTPPAEASNQIQAQQPYVNNWLVTALVGIIGILIGIIARDKLFGLKK